MRQEFRKVFIVSTKKVFSLIEKAGMGEVSRVTYRKIFSLKRKDTKIEVRISTESFNRFNGGSVPEKSVLIVAQYIPQEWEMLPFQKLYRIDWCFYDEEEKEKIIVSLCEDLGVCDDWKSRITDLFVPPGEKRETLKKVKEMLKKIEEEINED